MAKNKLNIYLLKEEIISSFNDLTNVIKSDLELVILEIGGDYFYFQDSKESTPKWVNNFFKDKIDKTDKDKLKSSTSKGLLISHIEVDGVNRFFAITFGYGRSIMKSNVWVEDFGLKVTLNKLDKENIKKIETKHLSGNTSNMTNQLSIASNIDSFLLDKELDVLNSITSKFIDKDFGNYIHGKESISFSADFDIINIKSILRKCYDYYLKNDYRESFPWVDNVKIIKNKENINTLNKIIFDYFDNNINDNKVNVENDLKIWMSVPDNINWEDFECFKYSNSDVEYGDILIEDFIEINQKIRKEKQIDFSEKNLKQIEISTISSSSGFQAEHWKAYNCIYAELEYNKKLYLLSNGNWYLLDNDYREGINNFYENIDYLENYLPDASSNIKEGSYNANVSKANPSFILFDKKNIILKGLTPIEFCDLFDTNEKNIIHVKNYQSSATLSHLFNQGVVSAELFINNEEFRNEVNNINKVIDNFDKNKINSYTIMYAIISKKDEKLSIPFFSKVTLKHAVERLKLYNFKFKLVKILRK